MKNRFFISIVSAIAMTALLSSCDLFDKADDVSFSTVVNESFVVMDAGAGSYSDEITLDLKDDAEVDKYKEKIQDITINELTFQVTGYEGPADAEFTGSMAFGSGGSVNVSIENFNLADASDSGEEFELDLSQSEVDEITNRLKNDKEVDIILAGNFSDGPVSFVIEVKLDAKVTADAL